MSTACAAAFDTPACSPRKPHRWPVLTAGFRPFYLGAAIFSASALPLWLLALAGALPGAGLDPYWHAHEMLYGYVAAVIAGFLFTAVPNWTGRPTPTGALLATLVCLWLAGRVLMLSGPAVIAAMVDLAFLPAVALAVALPIVGARIWRNLFIVLLLLLLGLANLAFHAERLGWSAPVDGRTALLIGLDVMAIMMAAIGGRVIPVFIRNAVAGAEPRREPVLEALAMGSLGLVLLLEPLGQAGQVPAGAWSTILAAAAGLHLARLLMWRPLAARRQPLLWILPLAYAWLPLALALRALAAIDLLAEAPAIHALTVGAIGGLTLAMMTRSALGHTGRPLVAGAPETTMFLLVQAAALLRVFGPLLSDAAMTMNILGGLAWSSAFGLFALTYMARLTEPRCDDRSG
jgi:uncharacterized protein involved in response to NO